MNFNIFINGCSFSESQHNKNGPWKPWSDYLLDNDRYNILNSAISSNGQGKILDNTVELIEAYPANLLGKPHLAIILFSAVSRGYSNNFDKFVEKVTQNTNYQSLLHEEEYNLGNESSVTDLITHVDWLFYKSTLCKIIVLKNYFENKKIPYLFFWGWQQITPEMESNIVIKSLLKKVYDANWWRFGEHGGMSEWGIEKFGKDKAVFSPEDFHPSSLVHKAFYNEIILPNIKKILNNIYEPPEDLAL